MPLQKENERYTYADYYSWEDNARWEIIDGIPYAMSPAPAPKHQRISIELSIQFHNFLKGKRCRLYPAPFDVRLAADGADDTVVQPDLSIICDHAKIDDRGCKGAPDLVVEILSPSTARHDRWVKYNLYRDSGVREYWIVDPETQTVSVNVLENNTYIGYAYGDTETAPVNILPGCTINLQEVFAE